MTEPNVSGQAAAPGRSSVSRERLVNAAAALFWRAGYRGTSLADIAHQSGVPVGNIYYYFKTKAAIAEAVGHLLHGQMREALEAIDASHSTPSERLAALFALFAAANQARTETGCPIAAACRSFEREAPEAAMMAAGAFTLMQDWIAANLRAGGHSESAAQAQALAWLASWQGGIALAHALKDRALLDQVTNKLTAEATRSAAP